MRKEKEMLPGDIASYKRLEINRSKRRNIARKLVMFMQCTVSLSTEEQNVVANMQYCM